MAKKVGDPCPYCRKVLTDDVFEDRRRRHSAGVKEALAAAKINGEPVGRPRSVDYSEIIRLKKEGLSTLEISEKMSTSKRTVSRALVQRVTKNNCAPGSSEKGSTR